MGFDPLNKFYNAQSTSIRHAGYIDFRRRLALGLNMTANYTFAKSIDDSSDASPDVRILTTGHATGQVALGGSLDGDRALSAFDVRHTITGTFTYDLPFGKGRSFFKTAPWYVNGPLGGWSLAGVLRLVSGNPYQPFLTDPNLLGGSNLNRVVRPDIVSGVPLKNPFGVRTAGQEVPAVQAAAAVNRISIQRPLCVPSRANSAMRRANP